jgi:hypothetical protein
LRPAHRDALISSLLLSPGMQALWDVRDRGMPVFVHSLDVALLCLDRLPAGTRLDADAVVLGALVHDASKLPLALPDDRSHSLVMRTEPDLAADVSMGVLAEAEERAGLRIEEARRAHVRHIVLSHHGRYGKVHPLTSEARLVAACDFVSGTLHRIPPVDANDILPLLSEGYRWREAAALLGVGREVIKTRLREACDAHSVRQWVDLLPIWRGSGAVMVGDARRQRQLTRARHVTRLARQVPECLLDRMRVAAETVACAEARGPAPPWSAPAGAGPVTACVPAGEAGRETG